MRLPPHLTLPAAICLAAATLVTSPGLAAEEDVRDMAGLDMGLVTDRRTDDLPVMKDLRIVRALVTFSRTDFFLSPARGARGLQAELLREYEKQLNKGRGKKDLRINMAFVPVPFNRLIPALLEGEGDIAAAMLTMTPERREKVAFATGGQFTVDEVVVTSSKVQGLETVEDLSGRKVYVLRGSSYVEHLKELNVRLAKKGRKPVIIQEANPHVLTEDILELVDAGIVRITVADDYKAAVWAQALPNLVVHDHLKVHTGGKLGWAIRKTNPELQKSLDAFARKVRKGTLLGNMLFKRYYVDTRWVKNPVTEQERRKLEKFWPLFKKYGDRYGFDYMALAAQAYQESGLDHSRRSHRGAIGVMQVLPSTARDKNVGIPDISSVENNIHAAAKYLAFLRDRYFASPAISSDDRLAFTWAAYNAGPAKVRRMRSRARKMGLSANEWFDNVEYAALKMVGQETVRYVANVYKYYVAYTLAEELQEKKTGVLEAKRNG